MTLTRKIISVLVTITLCCSFLSGITVNASDEENDLCDLSDDWTVSEYEITYNSNYLFDVQLIRQEDDIYWPLETEVYDANGNKVEGATFTYTADYPLLSHIEREIEEDRQMEEDCLARGEEYIPDFSYDDYDPGKCEISVSDDGVICITPYNKDLEYNDGTCIYTVGVTAYSPDGEELGYQVILVTVRNSYRSLTDIYVKIDDDIYTDWSIGDDRSFNCSADVSVDANDLSKAIKKRGAYTVDYGENYYVIEPETGEKKCLEYTKIDGDAAFEITKNGKLYITEKIDPGTYPVSLRLSAPEPEPNEDGLGNYDTYVCDMTFEIRIYNDYDDEIIPQTITVTNTEKTYKASALKKKKKTFRLKTKENEPYTNVSYEEGTSKDKTVTVNDKGKVTVKKGTKKGVHKVVTWAYAHPKTEGKIHYKEKWSKKIVIKVTVR